MADTIREQIITAFTIRAAALSNLPVNRAQRSIGETNDRFVSIWDGDDQSLGMQYGKERSLFPIAVECIVKTVDHSIEANGIMGEIYALFIGTDRTYGGLALKTEKVSISPSYPQDGSSYSTITGIFNITYETVIGDPTTSITP